MVRPEVSVKGERKDCETGREEMRLDQTPLTCHISRRGKGSVPPRILIVMGPHSVM